jgi:hypothetical protein
MPPCSLPSVVGANFAEGDAPDGSKIKAAQLCHLVRDEGVAGSNPATPTSSTTKALIGRSYLQTLIN